MGARDAKTETMLGNLVQTLEVQTTKDQRINSWIGGIKSLFNVENMFIVFFISVYSYKYLSNNSYE